MSIDRTLPPVSEEIRIQCRVRHMWDIVDSDHWWAKYGEPVTLRCMRCRTECRSAIARNGSYTMRPRYVYPPGYLKSKGEPTLTAADKRAMLIQQSILDLRKQRNARRKS